MKKLLSMTMAALMGVSALSVCASADENTIDMKYDFNSDGVVNSFDVFVLDPSEDSDLEITEETAANAAENGDINGDGVVDYRDSDLLLNMLFDNGAIPVDFNQNGVFDAFDTDPILIYYGEKATDAAESQLSDEVKALVEKYGDISGNGKIDAVDASMLCQRYVAVSLPGDVDESGTVDAVDAGLILEYYAKNQSRTFDNDYIKKSEPVFLLGDVNDDGNIDAIDACEVLSIYANAQTNNK